MKRLLIIVDYQVDFVNGSLGFKGAENLEKEIVKLIEEFKSSNDDVLFTKDIHFENYLDTEEGKYLPIKHCIENTEGNKLFGSLEEISKSYLVFSKPTFGSLDLAKYLKEHNYDEISLCGIDTSICVLSNAVIAKCAQPNAHIKLLTKACGCGDKEAEQTAIKALSRLQVEIVE